MGACCSLGTRYSIPKADGFVNTFFHFFSNYFCTRKIRVNWGDEGLRPWEKYRDPSGLLEGQIGYWGVLSIIRRRKDEQNWTRMEKSWKTLQKGVDMKWLIMYNTSSRHERAPNSASEWEAAKILENDTESRRTRTATERLQLYKDSQFENEFWAWRRLQGS